MDNQKINCTVASCKFNENNKICGLKEITVTPKSKCKSRKTDESMCGSYECNN